MGEEEKKQEEWFEWSVWESDGKMLPFSAEILMRDRVGS